ncbi:tetratricopeptide repeat protein, partial [Eisenbergiella massiliensis]
KGREKEAEEVLREVIKIDSKNIMSRTELGKLLSKQKGREKEAEEVLREVIKIDSKNLHARTVLAKLYESCNRQIEAVILYKEVCKYNPGNPFGERGLERLKKYINA